MVDEIPVARTAVATMTFAIPTATVTELATTRWNEQDICKDTTTAAFPIQDLTRMEMELTWNSLSTKMVTVFGSCRGIGGGVRRRQ